MAKAFPGSGSDNDARYERAGKWLLATIFGRKGARDWCDRKGVMITRAHSEGIGSSGGFLVPFELERSILDLRDSYGAFRRRACVYPLGSDSGLFPRRTGNITASFVGEGAAASQGTLNVDGVTLVAKKLAAYVSVANELDEDSIVDMVDYIATETAWALAAKEDDCGFNGDGTSTYGGMRGIGTIVLDGAHGTAKVTAGVGHQTYAQISPVDLENMMGNIRASAMPRAAWFASQMGFALVFARLAMGGAGVLSQGIADGIPTPFFNGYPVILAQKLPQVATALTGSAMLAFGDLYGAAVIGQRRGLTVAVSDKHLFETDRLAIMVSERFDGVVHDMGDNTNAGSITVLVGS